jgi:hypothetical protein
MDLLEFLAAALLVYLLWAFFQPENGVQGKTAQEKKQTQDLDYIYHQR